MRISISRKLHPYADICIPMQVYTHAEFVSKRIHPYANFCIFILKHMCIYIRNLSKSLPKSVSIRISVSTSKTVWMRVFADISASLRTPIAKALDPKPTHLLNRLDRLTWLWPTPFTLNPGNFVSILGKGLKIPPYFYDMIHSFNPPLCEAHALTAAPIIGLMFPMIFNTLQIFCLSFLYSPFILCASRCQPFREERSSSWNHLEEGE